MVLRKLVICQIREGNGMGWDRKGWDGMGWYLLYRACQLIVILQVDVLVMIAFVILCAIVFFTEKILSYLILSYCRGFRKIQNNLSTQTVAALIDFVRYRKIAVMRIRQLRKKEIWRGSQLGLQLETEVGDRGRGDKDLYPVKGSVTPEPEIVREIKYNSNSWRYEV